MDEFMKIFPNASLRKDTTDGDVDKEKNFWELRKTKGMAFLIESFFHTNREECRILQSEEGRDKIAASIVNTIIRIEKEV